MSFEQVFKQIDDILILEVPAALDYTENHGFYFSVIWIT
jgi:hypothetical protein